MVSRIVDITHFKDNKPSSQLIVDSESPSLTDKGYVKAGGFWFKPELQGKSMKISIPEAIEMATRMMEEVKRLIAEETQMRIEQASKFAKK